MCFVSVRCKIYTVCVWILVRSTKLIPVSVRWFRNRFWTRAYTSNASPRMGNSTQNAVWAVWHTKCWVAHRYLFFIMKILNYTFMDGWASMAVQGSRCFVYDESTRENLCARLRGEMRRFAWPSRSWRLMISQHMQTQLAQPARPCFKVSQRLWKIE